MARPYSELTDVELRRLYEDERWTQREIAEEFGKHAPLIYRRMARAGIEVRPPMNDGRRLSSAELAEQDARVIKLYWRDFSISGIGAQLGIGKAAISGALQRAGIEVRRPGQRANPAVVEGQVLAVLNESVQARRTAAQTVQFVAQTLVTLDRLVTEALGPAANEAERSARLQALAGATERLRKRGYADFLARGRLSGGGVEVGA